MGAVYFYHLTRQPLEDVLPMLLGKARQAGWVVLVRGRNSQRVDYLDGKLWLGASDSFLPHGRAGGEFDTDQPILLTTTMENPNNAACIMAVDGASVEPDEVQASERVCILFDGNDPEAVQHARGQWKTLTTGGCSAQYWSQEDGSWQKKAES